MKKSPVQAIDRAFAILKTLAASRVPLKATEIAHRLNLPPTTVHGLLRSLRNWRAVQHNARDGTYQVGIGIYELAQGFDFEYELKSIATPVLTSLCRNLNETVNIGILYDLDVLTLSEIVPERILTAREAPGGLSPLHTQARGKVLLAFQEKETCTLLLDRLVDAHKDSAHPVNLSALKDELATIRENGFGTHLHELETRVLSYAVPVHDRDDRVMAAIGVIIPHMRADDMTERFIVSNMQNAAADIHERWNT